MRLLRWQQRLVLLLFLFFSICSCKSGFEGYPIDGKWKLERFTYQFAEPGKPDSVVTADLGYVVFNKCEEDTNRLGVCRGERIFVNRAPHKFAFQMAHIKEGERHLEMMFFNLAGRYDLFQHFMVEKLTDTEMVMVCRDCGDTVVGMYKRFEVRATKVSP